MCYSFRRVLSTLLALKGKPRVALNRKIRLRDFDIQLT